MQAALASLDAEPSKSLPPRSGKSRTDWAPATGLRSAGEVTLTLGSQRPAAHRLLSAGADGLTVLDSSDPKLPDDVRRAGALVGGLHGLGIGIVVGALSPSRPDVVYHVY